MKRRERNYSVIIVSGATSTNKEFVLSSKLIRNSIIAFVALLTVFGFIIFDYLNISFDKEKMKRLEKENVRKDKTISELSTNMKEIEAKLKSMATFKERISVAMGLTSPNSLTEVGVGGPIENIPGGQEVPTTGQMIDMNENPALSNQNRDLKQNLTPPISTESILEKTKDIRNDAQKIENTLKFLESVMEEQKIRLSCTPSIWPTKGYLTSPFGMRIHPLTGLKSLHSGQDIATQYGNKIIAPADGIVLLAEYKDYYGSLLVIDHGFGFTTQYGHLASFAVREGQRVKRHQVIGYVGNSGRSSAPHLHYEVRFFGKTMNPMDFIVN